MLVEEALRRQRVFRHLGAHLQCIGATARRLDPKAEVYLFGSVAEARHTYASDVDVLVLTRIPPARLHAALWRAGIRDPFEVHIQPAERLNLYRRRARLVQIRGAVARPRAAGARLGSTPRQ